MRRRVFVQVVGGALARKMLLPPAGVSTVRTGEPLPQGPPGTWPWGSPRTEAERQVGYTSIQCDGPYLPGWDWQTDVVLAYYDNGTVDYAAQYASWQGHGYRVGTMIAATHDWQGAFTRGLYDGRTHYDLVQRRADGSYVADTGGAFWMAPVGEWIDYLETLCRRAIDAGSRLIVFDEPMYAFAAGYEAPFRAAWQERYGRPWEPQTAGRKALWDTCRLKALLWVQAFTKLARDLHDYAPGVEVYPAPHSVLDYAMWGIIFPHAEVLLRSGVDGMFYEVWGTFQHPTEQEKQVLPWERSYAEYAMSGALSYH